MCDTAKTFVIRQMSTKGAFGRVFNSRSDFNGRDPIRPYHIYLKPRGERAIGWWTRSVADRATFATLEEAEAEIASAFAGKGWYAMPQAVSIDDKSTFWGFQKGRSE